MVRLLLFALLLFAGQIARSDDDVYGLHVDVTRLGRVYTYNASFNTSLKKCGAYRYLTDYAAKKALPGVLDLAVSRLSANKARVELTADEPVLFFDVRVNSLLEYTEKPFERIVFRQLSGNSKMFQGSWRIEPNRTGSTLRYKGEWEPDTMIPLLIIDQFAEGIVRDKFTAIAQLAEKYQATPPAGCVD